LNNDFINCFLSWKYQFGENSRETACPLLICITFVPSKFLSVLSCTELYFAVKLRQLRHFSMNVAAHGPKLCQLLQNISDLKVKIAQLTVCQVSIIVDSHFNHNS